MFWVFDKPDRPSVEAQVMQCDGGYPLYWNASYWWIEIGNKFGLVHEFSSMGCFEKPYEFKLLSKDCPDAFSYAECMEKDVDAERFPKLLNELQKLFYPIDEPFVEAYREPIAYERKSRMRRLNR